MVPFAMRTASSAQGRSVATRIGVEGEDGSAERAVEAERVDIATKFPGRLREVLAGR